MEKKKIIHILRNPYGWPGEEKHQARVEAATLLDEGWPDLKNLLAQKIGVDPEEFSQEDFEVILQIGQGIYWSKEFDIEVRQLAEKVTRALNFVSQY